jgi:hypothetical protein
MPDETTSPNEESTASEQASETAAPVSEATAPTREGPPSGYVHDAVTGQLRPMTFMERARSAATQAAKVGAKVGAEAAKVGVEVGSQAAKAGADLSSKAAHQAAVTLRDPATKARAQSALRKAKRGFTTVLERIDPRILADVVVKATSLQEKANASLKDRGSAYRIGEITIGASFPPSIQFSIERVDDPEQVLHDSSVLLEKAKEREGNADAIPATIVGLDGTVVDETVLEELEDEDEA